MKFWQHLTWVEIDQQIECARFAEELGFDGDPAICQQL